MDLVFRMSRASLLFARAPSSLLFCGVRNTHKFLAFCKFFEEFGQCPSTARSIGFCVIWVCISSSSEGEGQWQNSSENLQKARNLWVLRTPQNIKEEGARAKKLVTCGTRSPLGRGQSVPFSAQGAYCSAPEPSKALTGQELLPRSRSGSE